MKHIRFIIPGIVLLSVILIFQTVFYIGYVPSESMEPTIPAESRILGIRIFSNLNVGDIIVFEHEGRNMVKRIAACPGDRLEDNSIVPDNQYYVLGDNVKNSYDSRYWDYPFIHRRNIKAIVLF